jgi:NADH-quinone oxidoreductase subunit C
VGDGVVGAHIIDGDDLWVRFAPEAWREAGQIAKGKLDCTYFCFLSTIDWLPSPWGRSEDSPLDVARDPATIGEAAPGHAGGDSRFQVFARVLDPTRGVGFTLKVDVPESMELPTWIPVYAGADWHEREAWEMYGVRFVGHPHLVHLYLPTEFEGHPGRKDFPLLARQVKPWPGIVDVEPMPDEAEDAAETEDAPAEEVSPA